MLREFFDFVAQHPDAVWLHWAMRRASFGFEVLAQRARLQGLAPDEIPPERRFDLSGYLKRLYGDDYVPHPRFPNVLERNGLLGPDFLDKEAASAAWANGEYARLIDSLSFKVDAIADLFERILDGTFKIEEGTDQGPAPCAVAQPKGEESHPDHSNPERPVPLVIGGIRGEEARQRATEIRQLLQERFGFVCPAEDVPLLEKLRRLHGKAEKAATFLRQNVPCEDGDGFPFGTAMTVGNGAALGFLADQIASLQETLRELFGLGGNGAVSLPVWVAETSVSVLRTFDVAREFGNWLSSHQDEVIIPADLARRLETAISLLHGAILSEEAANGNREEPASGGRGGSPAAPEDTRRVVLRSRQEGPIVLGREKPPLTEREYNIIQALLEAGERGLSKDKLDEKSGHSEARKVLKTLRESDPDWEAVIQMPGKAGMGGYRIK
jgi:hypothetical protein